MCINLFINNVGIILYILNVDNIYNSKRSVQDTQQC